MKRYFVVAVLVSALAGCASSGTMVTERQAAQFQKGITTRTEVLAKLGDPSSSTKADNGTRVDVYMHIDAHANAASYIPVVGILAGGATGNSTSAIFTYDPAGVLAKVETTTAKSKVNTGLLNQ